MKTTLSSIEAELRVTMAELYNLEALASEARENRQPFDEKLVCKMQLTRDRCRILEREVSLQKEKDLTRG